MVSSTQKPYTIIRGVAYDLTDFLKQHPGGEHMAAQAIGRDATFLFESYHVRNEIAQKQLEKIPKLSTLPFPAESGPFPNDSAFFRTVRDRVKKEILHGKSQRGGLILHIMVTFIAAVLGYYYYIFNNSALSGVILGLVAAHLGLTFNHCGNHGGLTKYPTINFIFGFADDLIGGSSLVWSYHHHISHHVYCNDHQKDQDVYTALPFLRFDKRQPRKWYNAYQHLYVGLLFPLLALTKHNSDLKALLKGNTKAVKMIGATNEDYQRAYIGKLVHFLITIGLPYYLHGSSAILPYVIHSVVGSSTLAWLFAVSHNLDDTKDDKPIKDWAVAQVEHSANYGGLIACLFTGGLNLQIEHHLFPAMSYKHYPAIAKIVKEESKNFKVKYTSFDYLPQIVFEFLRFLQHVGSQ